MFKNEPLTDFTVAANRTKLADALAELDRRIKSGALRARPIINGREIDGSEELTRADPSDPGVVIGKSSMATVEQAQEALRTLREHAAQWGNTDFHKRAECLQRLARILRDNKAKLTALIIREAAKPWKEADADVAEAIDFCEYYALEMLRIGPPRKTAEVMGEESFYLYEPRGVAVVISPWNFPLAIACGMAVAALVTGNATVLKPAEQTNLIAYELAKAILESGIPAGVFAFLPGYGESVGRALVESPLVNVICFTGSKAVGLEIINKASTVSPTQYHVKRVIAEMGGKNAIIVDEDADLDEAVKGALYSSFGYGGQKCSACSRVIVVGDAYEPFLARFTEAAADIHVGPASDPATLLGPVIDAESRDRILRTITEAEKSIKLAHKGRVPENGFFVPATIFRDVDRQSLLWREEIFGPVVGCIRSGSFEEAVAEAVSSQYALTGAAFTRSPSHIEYAKKHFKVGNLYINRGSTGALVCRHPFGGFKLSGVGSKAGGPDYLLQFVEPRTATENTMRRGFTPQSA